MKLVGIGYFSDRDGNRFTPVEGNAGMPAGKELFIQYEEADGSEGHF